MAVRQVCVLGGLNLSYVSRTAVTTLLSVRCTLAVYVWCILQGGRWAYIYIGVTPLPPCKTDAHCVFMAHLTGRGLDKILSPAMTFIAVGGREYLICQGGVQEAAAEMTKRIGECLQDTHRRCVCTTYLTVRAVHGVPRNCRAIIGVWSAEKLSLKVRVQELERQLERQLGAPLSATSAELPALVDAAEE
jgi:hypothetical protein